MRTVASAGVTVDNVRRFFASGRLRYFGPRPLLEDASRESAATTLVGLALGPFLAGWVSATHGGDISLGVRSTLWAAPIGFACLVLAIRLVPAASRGLIARAEAAGETGLTSA